MSNLHTITVHIQVELSTSQFERLVGIALKRGYRREHPGRAWTYDEQKRAAVYAIGNIALSEAMRHE